MQEQVERGSEAEQKCEPRREIRICAKSNGLTCQSLLKHFKRAGASCGGRGGSQERRISRPNLESIFKMTEKTEGEGEKKRALKYLYLETAFVWQVPDLQDRFFNFDKKNSGEALLASKNACNSTI